MSVSTISSSNASLYAYQWNSQQLQGTVSSGSTSSSAASSAYAYEGASTVSAMAELAKYAMEAMGVSSNDRVTFQQVENYKAQLEDEFSKELNEAIQNTIVSPTAYFTISMSDTGAVTVDTAHEDEALIQAFFDTNPSLKENLRQSLDDAGFTGDVEFTVSSTGDIMSVTPQSTTEEASYPESTLGTSIIEGLQQQNVTISQSFSVRLDGTAVVLEGSHAEADAINQYLQSNPNIASEIKATLESQGQSINAVVIINASGVVTSKTTFTSNESTEQAEKIQSFLQEEDVGNTIKDRMSNMGIDPNVDFRLTVVDGKVVVNSSHPDADKVQALLDSDEELTKTYLQVDALAGLDAARKSMQIDPTAMRKRIQMESLATWWDQTGTSSIGDFSAGNISTYTGVNSVA